MLRGSKAIPRRRFQWALDEPISSVPMLRYPLSPPIPSSSPQFYPLSSLLSTFLSLSLFLVLLFLLHIFLLIFLPVSPWFVFSLHRSAGLRSKSSISSFSFSLSLSLFFFLFLLPSQTPGLYATWKASGLKRDITGPSLASDTGTQKTRILSYPRRSL